MRDRKTFLIVLLILSAAILSLGHLQLNSVARADNLAINDDYELVTGSTQTGEDALYVLNKESNLVAIFTWDNSKRTIVVRDVKSMDALVSQ